MRPLFTAVFVCGAYGAATGAWANEPTMKQVSCVFTEQCNAKGQCSKLDAPVTYYVCKQNAQYSIGTKPAKKSPVIEVNETEYEKTLGANLEVAKFKWALGSDETEAMMTIIVNDKTGKVKLFSQDPLSSKAPYSKGACERTQVPKCFLNQ